jgi:hypothetical protein
MLECWRACEETLESSMANFRPVGRSWNAQKSDSMIPEASRARENLGRSAIAPLRVVLG